MKATSVALVVGLGCGATPPQEVMQPVYDPQPTPHPIYALRAPKPALDLSGQLADATEEARWPLSFVDHPILEPHFAIAAALAEPGVGWIELCGRGVQNRHVAGDQDLLDYLRAWCSVANRHAESALYGLGRLDKSTVPRLAAATKFDIANILVDDGDADHAEKLLDKSLIVDLAVVDLLAASYFEVDRLDDASEINRLAIQMDHQPSDAVKCRRLVRGIVVSHDLARDTLTNELHAISTPHTPDHHHRLPGDPTCVTLDDEVRCWLDRTLCGPYVVDQGRDARIAVLLAADGSWPTSDAVERQWLALAIDAHRAMPLAGAETLAVPALELALKTSLCNHAELIAIENAARDVRRDAPRDRSFDARLDALQAEIEQMLREPVPVCESWLARLPATAP